MITKYWRTIGYANICSSVQDNRLYESIWSTKEARKLGKRSKEGINIGSEGKKPLSNKWEQTRKPKEQFSINPQGNLNPTQPNPTTHTQNQP